jgi:hypothetical protein
MEINRFEEVMGVVPQADIVEGRFVIIKANVHSYDFGSKEDLPGCGVPATAEEAKRARFCLTWQVSNGKPPFYQPNPAYNWSLRAGGWDQATNLPMTSTTVYTTYPGYQNGVTIPSGMPSLAFGEGTYTIPSGGYINNASLATPGSMVVVANTAEDTSDAGKLKYQSTMDDRVVGFVEHRDSTSGALTVRIKR